MRSRVAWIVLTCGLMTTGHVLAASDAKRESRSAAEAAFNDEHPVSGMFRTDAGRVTSVYGPNLATGPSALDSANQFLLRHADLFNVDVADLRNHSLLEDGRPTQPVMFNAETGRFTFTLAYFAQYRHGIPVFGGEVRLLSRNQAENPVVLVRSALRDVRAFTLPANFENQLITQARMQSATTWAGPDFHNFSASRLVIWAGQEDQQPEPRLAYEFTADNGKQETEQYQARRFLVDALNGKLLHHESLVHHLDVTGVVRGNATDSFRADTCDPEVPTPLPYLNVTLGATTVSADVNGAFTIPTSGSGPFSLSSTVIGQFFRVNDLATTLETVTGNAVPGTPIELLFNAANNSEFRRAEMNAYIHINKSRDLVLSANPLYPTIFSQTDFNVYVNQSGSCNAFYDMPNAVRFFRAGSGCANMTIPTVVHHEYGHHVVQMAGSGQGAYGEGFGDTLGVLVSDDPISGAGYNGSCSSGGRSAANTVNYPCGGAAHICGQLLSGCVWDTRNALRAANSTTYRTVLNALAINSVLLHTGTAITPEITVDFLTLDDEDVNIFNGTPHYASINTGFSAHNMLPPAGIDPIGIAFPDGRPELLSPTEPTTFRVLVRGNTGTPREGTASLVLGAGQGFGTASLTQISPNLYEATLPAMPCGQTVSYYITASSTADFTAQSPSAAPANAYTAVSAPSRTRLSVDEAESDRGWALSATGDNATAGRWVRGDPVGSTSQAEVDHTAGSGVNCYYTGAGTADVDGGTTTLVTPTFSVADTASPKVSYWRWFSNNIAPAAGLETFVVDISNDNGATWSNVEIVGPGGPEARGGWVQHEFHVNDIVTPTAQMKLRFIASDLGADSTVEAAIDDLSVYGHTCPSCPSDWNNDGFNDSADLFAFIGDFFENNADFNNSGSTDSADFFDFLTAFLEGC